MSASSTSFEHKYTNNAEKNRTALIAEEIISVLEEYQYEPESETGLKIEQLREHLNQLLASGD